MNCIYRISSKILLLLFVLASFSAIAQDDRGWQVGAKLFAANMYVKDQVFSELKYSGWVPGGGINALLKTNRSLHEWEASYAKGNLEREKNRAQQTYITGDYSYLHQLNKNYMAGGSINILYAQRDYSNFINYNISNELVASLSAAGAVSLSFGNGFSLRNRLQIPLVSMVMQPSIYEENSPGKTGSGLKDFLKSNQVAGFGKFLRFKNNLILEKELGSHQSLSFAYCWDYYQVRTNPGLQQASHQLGFSYRYIF